MKTPILLLSLCLVACGSSAADPEATLRSDAEWMCSAVVKGDPDVILNHTYPGLVEKVGGRDTMREMIVAGLEDLKKNGLAIASTKIVSIGETVQAGSELHAIVRLERVVRSRTGRQIQDTFVIAVSNDDGENWTFVDGKQLTPAHIKALFPEFNEALVLPQTAEPVFERDDKQG